MANESKVVQHIPLGKVHDLSGVTIPQRQDKTLGGLVSSIQSGGIKEPVILRKREDGEYQLLSGYRRKRAAEMAKLEELPAAVYEMTLAEAQSYFRKTRLEHNVPVPGKLIESAAQEKETPISPNAAPLKTGEEKPATVEVKKTENPYLKEKETVADPKTRSEEKEKEFKKEDKKPVLEEKSSSDPLKKGEKKVQDSAPTQSTTEKASSASEDKAKKELSKADEKKMPEDKIALSAKPGTEIAENPKEAKGAAQGPSGTIISKIFEPKLSPPDEKALKELPLPKEGEAFYMTLHPGYLEKSKFNNFSVDKDSENYKELKKAIELAGVKDPVLARPKEGGGLEILSGQRRHAVAQDLNYALPVIVQLMDDDDAKILVADANLHRDKISSYDLSRALRMKMDAMKRKAGRRSKADKSAPRLNTDETLAQEMGITVSKLNRMIRLAEATKDVCARYDSGEMELSVASAISFLSPKNQTAVIGISIGSDYKLTTKRIERMKPLERENKLDSAMIHRVLQDKDLEPVIAPVSVPTSQPASPSNVTLISSATGKEIPTSLPSSPNVPQTQAAPLEEPKIPTEVTQKEPPNFMEDDVTKGAQERPEHTKIILTGDRLRKYFPDISMTPREIEEQVYEALDEWKKRREKQKEKEQIFKKEKAR